MRIMGQAMHDVIINLQNVAGIPSDNDDQALNDEEFDLMSEIIDIYRSRNHRASSQGSHYERIFDEKSSFYNKESSKILRVSLVRLNLLIQKEIFVYS